MFSKSCFFLFCALPDEFLFGFHLIFEALLLLQVVLKQEHEIMSET